MRRQAPRARRPPIKLPTVRQLLDDVAAGIRVLSTRDGVPVSEEQVIERARNIVAGLVGNYRIHSLDAGEPRPARALRQLGQLDLLGTNPRRQSRK